MTRLPPEELLRAILFVIALMLALIGFGIVTHECEETRPHFQVTE